MWRRGQWGQTASLQWQSKQRHSSGAEPTLHKPTCFKQLLFLLPHGKVFLTLARKGEYIFFQEARPTQEFLTLAQHPAALLCHFHLLKQWYKLYHQNDPDWETVQDDMFTQRHEWCSTIYTACNSLLAKTCKEGQVYITNICAPSLCSTIPSTRHTSYQTIPRTKRIWHFCQTCWFKLPYNWKDTTDLFQHPPTHTWCASKYLQQTLPGTLHQVATASLIQNKGRSRTVYTEPTSGLELLFRDFTLGSPSTA